MPDVKAATRVGPGWLRVAPLGTAEPTDLTTAWNAAFVQIGYTESGYEFEIAPEFEDIEVAEELTPIASFEVSRAMNVRFTMAEYTAANLKTALNGGTITTTAGVNKFEPPPAGTFTEVMLGWESFDGMQRKIWRRCVQTGSVTITGDKAPARATIPADFRVLVPAGGGAPFIEFIDANYTLPLGT